MTEQEKLKGLLDNLNIDAKLKESIDRKLKLIDKVVKK